MADRVVPSCPVSGGAPHPHALQPLGPAWIPETERVLACHRSFSGTFKDPKTDGYDPDSVYVPALPDYAPAEFKAGVEGELP